MLVKCSFCGKQKIVETELYGSPIFHCDKCNKLFYDPKIKEPALSSPPVNEREKLSFLIYLGVPFGFGFTIFGLSGVFTYSSECLIPLILGIVFMFGSILLIWSTYRDKRKRDEHYQALLKESHQRLSKFSYQTQLIVASEGNSTIVSLLKKYNSSHHLDFVLDIDSIFRNYESKNNETNTNEEKQKQTDETVDLVEESTTKEEEKSNDDIKLFCRKCGTELLLDSDFCHRCGEKVSIK